jgi:16S rRNA processing protein RimM
LKIKIGKLHRPHGIHGEIKFQLFFDPDTIENLTGSLLSLAQDDDGQAFELRLSSIRPGPKKSLARFEGIDSPEQAGRLTNCSVFAPREKLPDLAEGRYYYEEIIGLPVFDPGGAKLGTLTEFFSAGEKDVWVINGDDGSELLVPCIPETLKEVDLKSGKIVIKPMDETED